MESEKDNSKIKPPKPALTKKQKIDSEVTYYVFETINGDFNIFDSKMDKPITGSGKERKLCVTTLNKIQSDLQKIRMKYTIYKFLKNGLYVIDASYKKKQITIDSGQRITENVFLNPKNNDYFIFKLQDGNYSIFDYNFDIFIKRGSICVITNTISFYKLDNFNIKRFESDKTYGFKLKS